MSQLTSRPQESAAGAGPNAASRHTRRQGPASHSADLPAPGAASRGGSIVAHTTLMTGRQLRAITRQPAYIVIMLIQPVIWLFLFGSLFRKVVELPGFGTASYLDYLVPGVVIMSALSASMWSGMTVLEEIDRGVMDRFLVLPLHRSAIINASAVMQALIIAVQSIIIVLLGWAGGAHYAGGVAGLVVLIVTAVLVAIVFSAFSNTVGMLARQRETIIGINSFLLLPLTFLSTAFMAEALMPHWMRVVANCNPINWALEAGRSAMSANPDWARVGIQGGGLAVLAIAVTALSVLMFRAYQKSVYPRSQLLGNQSNRDPPYMASVTANAGPVPRGECDSAGKHATLRCREGNPRPPCRSGHASRAGPGRGVDGPAR